MSSVSLLRRLSAIDSHRVSRCCPLRSPRVPSHHRRCESTATVLPRDVTAPTSASASASSKPWSITTPIFYVNGPPHLGHLYTALLADARARTERLWSRSACLLTGTDEHGNKVLRAAFAANAPTEAFVDAQSHQYRAVMESAGVSFAQFLRTTDSHHVRVVQDVWQRLAASGDIYLGRHEGWYCTAEEAFIPVNATEDVGEGRRVNAANGLPVEWQSEENFMFRLSHYQQRIIAWLVACPDVIQPAGRRAEVVALLASPLQDISVSRLRVNASWGIAVPGHAEHTIYVWFDALLSYLAACIEREERSGHSLAPTALWPPDVQLVGKDILRFHAVHWPAFLLALDLPLPRLLVAHGHWTVEGRKMSKSLGNVVDAAQLLSHIGQDATRWALLTAGHYGDDSDWKGVASAILKYNNELSYTLGNLISRCCSQELLQPRSALPAPPTPDVMSAKEHDTVALLQAMEAEVLGRFRAMEYTAGVQAVMRVLRALNAYFNERQPWKLRHEDPQAMNAVLYVTLEGCRMALLLLQPIIPEGAARALDKLAVPPEQRTMQHYASVPVHPRREHPSVLVDR